MQRAGVLVAVLGWLIYFFGLNPEASMALDVDLTSLSENVMHLGYFLFLAGLLKAGLDAALAGRAVEAESPVETTLGTDRVPPLDLSMLVDSDCERGTIGGRRYVARNDGSLDMETSQGWKRFRTMEEALAHTAVH